jgi:hypothetical protein
MKNTIGNAFGLLCIFVVLLGIAQSWDDEDGRAMAAELKDRALKYAVEHYGDRNYFRSDYHCRVPMRGERLEMQHATAHDPGRGYRCLYRIVMPPPGAEQVATIAWSRSPELGEERAVPARVTP